MDLRFKKSRWVPNVPGGPRMLDGSFFIFQKLNRDTPLYLTKSIGFLFPQKVVVLKNFWSKKNLLAPQKIFDLKKFLAPKKIMGPKKNLGPKNVWSKKQSIAKNQFLVDIFFGC